MALAVVKEVTVAGGGGSPLRLAQATQLAVALLVADASAISAGCSEPPEPARRCAICYRSMQASLRG